jgi:hypothetical protein
MLPVLTLLVAGYLLSNTKTQPVMYDRINNGYQYRDVLFDTIADNLQHPDVVNNVFGREQNIKTDRGVFGIPREFRQLYPNASSITVMHNNKDLIL